jgi:hypothetical protein
LMRIQDPGWKKVGSGINIPDLQHWLFYQMIRIFFRQISSFYFWSQRPLICIRIWIYNWIWNLVHPDPKLSDPDSYPNQD